MSHAVIPGLTGSALRRIGHHTLDGGAGMIASTHSAMPRRGAASAGQYTHEGADRPRLASVRTGSWIEPGTRQAYPTSYHAYRRAREAEEKPLARHRALGADVDHYLWRRWRHEHSP